MYYYFYNQNNYPPPVIMKPVDYQVPFYNMNDYEQPYYYRPRPKYPSVNTTVFNESAVAFQMLMREASKIIDKISSSNTFAAELMSAAQESNQSRVDQIINSTGVSKKVKTTFNPDSLKIMLSADVKHSECCQLTMVLRWS